MVHSHFACRNTIIFFALGFSDVCRFCDDAEEASLKIPWRPTAAVYAGARGLAEGVSSRINAYQLIRLDTHTAYQAVSTRIDKGPFGLCMFFAHWRQPTSGYAGRTVCLEAASAVPGFGACMTCMVRTVLTIHVRQAQVHLPKLPLSDTKASLAKLNTSSV